MKSGVWLSAIACAALCGCRTTQDVLNDYEKNLVAGSYAVLPVETGALADKGDDTRLLWNLMAGTGHYLADDRTAAQISFDRAEDIFAENDRKSVYAQAGSGTLAMMTNDRAFPYAGYGQDRIFACFYKAVDYAASGNAAAARTEFNRAAQHQENWIWERRRDIAAADERLENDAVAYEKEHPQQANRDTGTQAVLADAAFAEAVRAQCGYDPAVSGNLDTLAPASYMNLHVHYACGVWRWLAGDDGRNFIRDVVRMNPAQASAARDFADIEAGRRPVNQVWIFVEDGLCPVREEWRIDLPFALIPGLNRYVLYAGMAFPRLRERAAAARDWTIEAGGVAAPFAPTCDFDHLLRTEYDVYMRGALTREITRTIVKVGAQVALGIAAHNTDDWRHQAALTASQIGVATWAATTTAADIRSWTALPKKGYAVRVDRPADGQVTILEDGVRRYKIPVPPGNTILFVRQPAASAPPVVKTVSFPR